MPTKEQPQHLCLDAGYDYDAVFETVRGHHYEPHIRPTQQNRAHAKPTPQLEAPTTLVTGMMLQSHNRTSTYFDDWKCARVVAF